MRMLVRLVLLLIPFSSSIYGLPLDNPWAASLLYKDSFCTEFDCGPHLGKSFSFRMGFYEDYVKDRKLEVDTGGRDAQLHQVWMRTDAAYLALNLCNYVDIFSTLGSSHLEVLAYRSVWNRGRVPQGNELTYLLLDHHFSWSIGARATLWQCGCLGVGLETQYFYTRPKLDNFRAEQIVVEGFQGSGNHYFEYREYQVGLGIAYKLITLSPLSAGLPYAGIKWSRVRTTTNDTIEATGDDEFFDLKNQRSIGYAVGFTFVWSSAASLSIEARFLDETAYHLIAQIAF